jgi:leucyl aminopeptidase
MTNDQRLVDMLTRAAKTSGEKFWQLPLPHVYQPMIESEVADMKNVASKPKAGALIAGLILEKFVGDIPWIHLDIAGPARSDTSQGFLTKGATGFGVLTLIELLQSWEILGAKAMGAKNC